MGTSPAERPAALAELSSDLLGLILRDVVYVARDDGTVPLPAAACTCKAFRDAARSTRMIALSCAGLRQKPEGWHAMLSGRRTLLPAVLSLEGCDIKAGALAAVAASPTAPPLLGLA